MYGPIKIDFGLPNAKIGQKMTNGRLLFLVLLMVYIQSVKHADTQLES